MTSRYCYADTPLGTVLLTGDGDALNGVYFTDHLHSPQPGPAWDRDDDGFVEARHQLGEYFDGGRTRFDLALALHGSPFERSVWAAVGEIPFGETASYGEIARRVGRPGAARAVGAANGRNAVCIVVPCHRVIGADRSLTGYAWGVDRKSWLLDHEVGNRPEFGPRPAQPVPQQNQ